MKIIGSQKEEEEKRRRGRGSNVTEDLKNVKGSGRKKEEGGRVTHDDAERFEKSNSYGWSRTMNFSLFQKGERTGGKMFC